MTKSFQQKPSSRAASLASPASCSAQAAQCLSDTDLAGINGGAEHGEIQFRLGSFSNAEEATLPFSSGLQQLPVGALDPDSVPWAELKPAVKKLASAGWDIPPP